MAKRKTAGRANGRKKGLKRAAPRRSVKRPTRKAPPGRPSARARTGPARRLKTRAQARKKAAPRQTGARKAVSGRGKPPMLDRARRTLDETVPTPPSSLNMRRQGSAARTGRAELAERLREHGSMSPATTC